MPLPAAHFRPAQSVVKTVFAPPDLSLRGGRRPPRPLRGLAMTHQVILWCTSALLPLNCCVQGAQGAPLQADFGSLPFKAAGTKRQCLPEIATSACGLLAMTNLMAVTILSTAYTSWEFCAGPGCPLPYNGVCGRRSARESAAANGAQGASLQAPPGAFAILTAACANRQHYAGAHSP